METKPPANRRILPLSADEIKQKRQAVAVELTELERLCGALEVSLLPVDWPVLGEILAASRKTMHAFENAMADAVDARDEEFDRVVFARLQRIYAYREAQMKRLKSYRDEVGDRLKMLSKWKGFARGIGAKAPRKTSGLDLLQ
jgi:hypothetical protein